MNAARVQRPSKKLMQSALTELRLLHKAGYLRTEAGMALGKWIASIVESGDTEVPVDSGATFASVRSDFWSAVNTKDPVACPCCGQTAKIYRRNIYGGMAAALIALYREDESNRLGWVSVESIYGKGLAGDYAKLRFWNLIESKDTRSKEANASGYWRITQAGRDFVEGKTTVPKYALVFDNECRGLDGDQVTIQECLGSDFDYGKLMKGE